MRYLTKVLHNWESQKPCRNVFSHGHESLTHKFMPTNDFARQMWCRWMVKTTKMQQARCLSCPSLFWALPWFSVHQLSVIYHRWFLLDLWTASHPSRLQQARRAMHCRQSIWIRIGLIKSCLLQTPLLNRAVVQQLIFSGLYLNHRLCGRR